MKCPNCGNEVNKGASYCVNCGRPLSARTPINSSEEYDPMNYTHTENKFFNTDKPADLIEKFEPIKEEKKEEVPVPKQEEKKTNYFLMIIVIILIILLGFILAYILLS